MTAFLSFQFGIRECFCFCIWSSVALSAVRLVLQGCAHDSVWTPWASVKNVLQHTLINIITCGSEMEKVDYFWHLYSKVRKQIVQLSLSWRLLGYFLCKDFMKLLFGSILVERDYKQWNVLNQLVFCYMCNWLHRSCFQLTLCFPPSLILT